MLKLEYWPPEKLRPYARALRKHYAPDRLARLIQKYGFRVPILATTDGEVIKGAGRLKALATLPPEEIERLDLAKVPVIPCDDLSPDQVRGLRLALTKSQEWAEWDAEGLALELQELADADLDFNIEDVGFSQAELEAILEDLNPNLEPPDLNQKAKAPKPDRMIECPKCGFRWQK